MTVGRVALAEALRLLDARTFDRAEAWFTRALALGTEEGDRLVEAGANRGLGLLLAQRGDYAGASERHRQAVRLFEAVGDMLYAAFAHESLGLSEFQLNRLEAARREWELALARFEQAGSVGGQAGALYNLLFVVPRGDPARGELAERGLRLARDADLPLLQGQFLHMQGDDAFAAGRFAVALERLDAALALLERAGPSGQAPLARVLISLGRLYRAHGHYELALEPYRRSLAIQERSGDLLAMVGSLNAIGVTHGYLGNLAEEKDHFRRALELARRTDSTRVIDFQTFQLANAVLKEDPAGAVAMMQPLAERMATDAEWLFASLAMGYERLDRLDEAAIAADRAIASAERQQQTEPLYLALATRARIRDRQGRPGEALTDARAALDVIDRLRGELVPTDFMKRGFGDQHEALFTLVIDLLFRRGAHAEALEVAERARARAFADLLATRAVAVPAGRDGAGDVVMRGVSAHADLFTPREPWLPSTETAASLSAGEVASLARRLGSTILSYWVTPEAIYAWRVGADGEIDGARVAADKPRLEALVRDVGSLRSQAIVTAASRGLYDLLVRPFRARLPAEPGSLLTIVGHGPILLLSFAGLQDERGRYLLEDYALHYAPGGAILDLAHRGESAPPSSARRYLLVAAPDRLPTTGPMPLPPLPGARQEVAGIARVLPPASVTTLTGARASEPGVRREVLGRSVLHFATHGVLDQDRPLESFLALEVPVAGPSPPGPPAPLDDGRLTAAEIYGLDLDADLVVLSACRSGGGIVSADGLFGLVRAFIAAGSSSVIASVWDVADEPAARLLPDVYRHLNSGTPPSAALRLAQLRLLSDLRAGRVTVATPGGRRPLGPRPALWAGFVLVGQP